LLFCARDWKLCDSCSDLRARKRRRLRMLCDCFRDLRVRRRRRLRMKRSSGRCPDLRSFGCCGC
jgi:hypothetical protein